MPRLSMSGVVVQVIVGGVDCTDSGQGSTKATGLIDGAASPDYSPPGHTCDVYFDMPEPASVDGYSVTASYRYASQFSPKGWTLQGSNDRSTWTTLDTKTAQPALATNGTREYTLSSTSGAYRYFRWSGLTTGKGDYLWVGDLGLNGAYGLPETPQNFTSWGTLPI